MKIELVFFTQNLSIRLKTISYLLGILGKKYPFQISVSRNFGTLKIELGKPFPKIPWGKRTSEGQRVKS
jgi:hypothetical protein